MRNEGDAYAALASAAKKLEADYYVPHYAHATMECPAATARIVDGACEIWAPSQSPQAARDRVAKALNLPADKVTVNVTLLGGGFGRKSKADFVVEAALVSKEMDGKPVKLTWTREDDLHNDYFHAVSAQHLEAGARRQRQGGRLAAPRGRADDRLDLRARPEDPRARSSWDWASPGCRTRSRTCASRTPRRSRTRASAGCGR